jgi:predicted nucleic acid-binding protein
MKWLLDTNVICEPGKRRPNSKVVAWLDSLQASECALSVITLGEIDKGIRPARNAGIMPPLSPR